MFLWDFVFNFWTAVTELLFFGKRSIKKSLSVYIKSNDGKRVSVDLDPSWDIKSVKELVGPKLGLEGEDIKIILAGKELDDSTTIEECDLGDQSTVYCVPDNSPRGVSRPLRNKILSDLSEEEVAGFFVACSHCRGVCQGKLRVRCADCKSGAITVDRDPAVWADVLQPRMISGHCEENGCPAGAVAWCEFYFRCREHISATDTAVPLPLIHANIRSVPCLACTEICDTVLVFECEERHTICLDCFLRYTESRLRERGFVSTKEYGYTLLCPAGCPNSYISEPHHFRILPQHLYDQYQRFGTEECLLAAGGVLCPRPNCGAGIFPDPSCNRVTCSPGCGFVFCKLCLEGYHLGDCDAGQGPSPDVQPSYSVDPNRAAQARWEEASKKTIKVSTKPCPKCRIPTERAGGCMHMLCSRCTLEWCWVCQSEWTRDCMASHWFG